MGICKDFRRLDKTKYTHTPTHIYFIYNIDIDAENDDDDESASKFPKCSPKFGNKHLVGNQRRYAAQVTTDGKITKLMMMESNKFSISETASFVFY